MKPTGSHSRLPRVYYGAGASAGAVAWQGAWHHVFHALQPRPEGAWPDLHPPSHKPPHIPQTNLTRRPGTVSGSGRGNIPSAAAAQPFPPVLRPHPERAAPAQGEGCTKPRARCKGFKTFSGRGGGQGPGGTAGGAGGLGGRVGEGRGGPEEPRVGGGAPRGAAGERPLRRRAQQPGPRPEPPLQTREDVGRQRRQRGSA